MDWTRTMNSKDPSPEQAVQEYLAGIRAELNLRLLCEAADEQMLWIESITVTDYKTPPPRPEKDRTEGKAQKFSRIASLWERMKHRLLGRKGKKKNRTHSP